MIKKKPVRLGLEKLLEENSRLLKGLRSGLICNQASVDHGLQHAADLLNNHSSIQLKALFGPQHGIRGDVQDNMIETRHAHDEVRRVPVYSLYSEVREPTEEMLKDLDVIVVDLQLPGGVLGGDRARRAASLEVGRQQRRVAGEAALRRQDVGDEQLGPVDHGAGNGDALLLAAGQLRRKVVHAIPEPDASE